MDQETITLFLNKFVQLAKRTDDKRTFKLYGTIKKVTEDSVTIETNQGLGAILLRDVVSIREAERKK